MRLNKLAKRIFAVGMAVSMMMASTGISFGAYEYDSVAGGTTGFTKYLALEDGVTVPNVEFTFTVASGTADEANGILAGPAGATVTYGSDTALKFDSSMSVADVTDGAIDGTAVTGTKYAQKDATVDFTGVSFSKPGIYRYELKEDTVTAPGITRKSNETLYLDVFVTDNNGALAVSSYVLHTDSGKPTAQSEEETDTADKVKGFVNEYTTQELTFEKQIAGNQGDKTKYFEFTLELENENLKGSTIAVDISGATSSDNTGKTSITLDATTGKASETYKLTHGDKVVVKGLPEGTKYTVKDAYEDYTATATGGTISDDPTAKTASISDTIASAAVDLVFTNTKNGTIPTGVILDSAPFILVIALAAAALVITAVRKRAR